MTSQKLGNVIDGRFRVEAVIGSGGFGHVYRADDQSLNRKVAVKVLDVLDASDVDAKARFEREAQVLSSLRHAHIVSVYNYGNDDSGRPYISMQYLEGKTLAATVRSEEKLPWRRAAAIAEQVCQALEAAHKHGVVHRDLKPENIMLLDDPEADYVMVLDFGLSGFVFGAEGETLQKLTQTGAVMGTALYMSPEVCRGQKANQRSDIYSLGCILYQCLTGDPPLVGEDPLNMLYKHVHELPARLTADASIPAEMELIVFKAMQKDPADRFQSMAEFEQALDAVRGGKTPNITTVKFTPPAVPKASSPKWLFPSICLGVIVACAAAFHFIGGQSKGDAADSWDTAQTAADLAWSRSDQRLALDLYLKALKVAPDRHRRYLSEISAARSGLLKGSGGDPELRKTTIEVLRQAVSDSESKQERDLALTMLGCAAQDSNDWELAYMSLKDQPWHSVLMGSDKFMKVSAGGRAEAIFAESLIMSSHHDYAQARQIFSRQIKEINPEEQGSSGEARRRYLLARATFDSSDQTATEKAKAIAAMKEALPLLTTSENYSQDCRYIRKVIGSEEYAKITSAKVAPRPRTVSERGLINWTSAYNRFIMAPQARTASAADKGFMDAIEVKHRIRSSVNEQLLQKSLNVGYGVLKKYPNNKRAQAVSRTFMGLGCYEYGRYDEALKLLADKPWLLADPGDIERDWKDNAAVCLAGCRLMFDKDPEAVITLLTNWMRADTDLGGRYWMYIRPRGNTFLAVAYLMTERPENRKKAEKLLEDVVQGRESFLDDREEEFVKDQLKRHHMEHLWWQ